MEFFCQIQYNKYIALVIFAHPMKDFHDINCHLHNGQHEASLGSETEDKKSKYRNIFVKKAIFKF